MVDWNVLFLDEQMNRFIAFRTIESFYCVMDDWIILLRDGRLNRFIVWWTIESFYLLVGIVDGMITFKISDLNLMF